MTSSLRLAPAVLLFAFVGLAPAHAGTSKAVKKAKATLVKNAAVAIDEYATVLKVRRVALFGALDALDAELKSGLLGTSVADVDDLFQALADYQREARGDWESARIGLYGDLGEAFAILFDAGLQLEEYPDDFRYSTGGLLDGVFVDLAKLQAKEYEKIRKRVTKTVKTFRKAADVAITFRIEPAISLVGARFAADGSWGTWNSAPSTFDILMTASDLTATDDGRLYCAGAAWFTQPVEIRLVSDPNTAEAATMSDGWRWEATLAGLPEGGDQVVVHPIGESSNLGIVLPFSVP